MFRAICRVSFLLALAILMPRFLLLYAPQRHLLSGRERVAASKLEFGLMRWRDFAKHTELDLKSKSLLLVTNQIPSDLVKNGHLKQFNSLYLQLLAKYGLLPNVVCQLQHEHIFTKINDQQSEQLVAGKFSKKPPMILSGFTSSDIRRAGLVVADLQASGLVQDQALPDLINLMQLCAKYRKQLIILDRPNPLGYLQEGPLVDVLKQDFAFYLPLRHGLTLGEVAGYANYKLFNDQVKLLVLPLKHYMRNSFVDFEQLQKVYTLGLFNLLRACSPMELKTDCYTNFQCLSLPEYLNFTIDKWYELRAALLWQYHMDVSLCRYMDRRKDQYYVGLRLAVDDINRVSYLKIWQLFFKFMRDANINLQHSLLLAQLFGVQAGSELITGNLSAATLDGWQKELKIFYKQIKPYLIYRPWPVKI
jgi:hypothetical protein